MSTEINIGVFGHYGNQNLGDEAITQAVIDNLKSRNPSYNIFCFSINPEDSKQRHNIQSYPIRYLKKNSRQKISNKVDVDLITKSDSKVNSKSNSTLFTVVKKLPAIKQLKDLVKLSVYIARNASNEIVFLRKSNKVVSSMDIILVCGSNQFLDNFGGPWAFPYTLLKWSLLSRLNNVKIAFVSIGAGPLTRKLSYLFLKYALNNAAYISLRDIGSKELIETNIPGIKGSVFPDLAHNLPYRKDILIPVNCENVVGVNVMPVYDRRYWADPDDIKYKNYVKNISRFCKQLLNRGYNVKLFTTQKMDQYTVQDVMTEISNYDNTLSSSIYSVHDETVDELMSTINSCKIIVATRFHATVLPLQLGKPVLGVTYYRKSSELLEDVGLGNYHVECSAFDVKELMGKFDSMMENYDFLVKNVIDKHSVYKSSLEKQYDMLEQLIAS